MPDPRVFELDLIADDGDGTFVGGVLDRLLFPVPEMCINGLVVDRYRQIDVDLFVEASVASLSAIVLGRTDIAAQLDQGNLYLSGDARLIKTVDRWLSRGAYADVEGIEMA